MRDLTDLKNKLLSIPNEIASFNYAPALEGVVEVVHESTGKNYGRQVDEDGAIWPPRKDNLPHPLLILSGAMLEASTGGVGSFVRYQRDAAEIGIRQDVILYGWIHNEGTAKIPRRQYMYLNEQERPEALRKFVSKLTPQLSRDVFRLT